jgi:hypothetical protein
VGVAILPNIARSGGWVGSGKNARAAGISSGILKSQPGVGPGFSPIDHRLGFF